MKIPLLLLAGLLLAASASAQVFIWDNDGTRGNIIGQPGGVQSYYGSDGTYGSMITPGPQGGVGSYQFSRPDGTIQAGTFWQAPAWPPVDREMAPAFPVIPAPRSYEYRMPRVEDYGIGGSTR